MAVASRDASAQSAGDVLLEARDLSRRFGAVVAVDRLSFTVRGGELYGLVGPDGAGKTTSIRMLTGLVPPDSGKAFVLGQPATGKASSVREAVGYMPQQYSLYGDLSVDENLRFFADLFGLGRSELARRRARLLGITRLERFSARRADALSGGMYKKLALACALLHQPRVLVLDEPTNGVDPVSRRELWDLLYEFVADGMAVVLATPYMDEAERCHRVGLIDHGTLLAEGPPRELSDAFPHASFVLATPDRAALELALDARPEVLSLTPHGAALRVVVHRDAAASFAAAVASLAAVERVTRVRPDFEDVFLGLIAGERRDVAPSARRGDVEGEAPHADAAGGVA